MSQFLEEILIYSESRLHHGSKSTHCKPFIVKVWTIKRKICLLSSLIENLQSFFLFRTSHTQFVYLLQLSTSTPQHTSTVHESYTFMVISHPPYLHFHLRKKARQPESGKKSLDFLCLKVQHTRTLCYEEYHKKLRWNLCVWRRENSPKIFISLHR